MPSPVLAPVAVHMCEYSSNATQPPPTDKSTGTKPEPDSEHRTEAIASEHHHDVENGHGNHHHHDHSHSHGLFGHSHGHDDDDHGLIDALQSGSDKGARITVIGLVANVLLTASKGLAGWFMNSAALLAEAGHSLSDLLGDLVVLFSWRLSRRAPSARYPFGLAKFETLGTAVVALLLLSGGLGIGIHALQLLLAALQETAQTLPPGALQTTIQNVTEVAHNLPAVMQTHAHHHHAHAAPALDPNAAWFAAISVIAKEWLFRITRKVAAEEGSPVLMANAYHHRSDAYSSGVALAAILGSTFFPALPLDPIGGILVSLVIIRQGVFIAFGACRELTDASVSPPTLRTLERALDPLCTSGTPTAPSPVSLHSPHSHPPCAPESPSTPHSPYSRTAQRTIDPLARSAQTAPALLSIDALRARRAGSSLFVSLTARVRPDADARALATVEARITEALRGARRDVGEVSVKFAVGEEGGVGARTSRRASGEHGSDG